MLEESIVLVEGNKIISGDIQVAQIFNFFFFETAVNTLVKTENTSVLSDTEDIDERVENGIKMFEIHPASYILYTYPHTHVHIPTQV